MLDIPGSPVNSRIPFRSHQEMVAILGDCRLVLAILSWASATTASTKHMLSSLVLASWPWWWWYNT